MSDYEGDDPPGGAPEGGGTGGTWFPEPTALQPPPGEGDGPGGPGIPGGPRRTSGTKILTYALLFICLVAVSLYLRSNHNKTAVNSPGSSASPTEGIVAPHFDAAWLGPACVAAEPGSGFVVKAGYAATAGVVASWEDALSAGQVTSSASTLPIGTAVGVCYIDGPWKVPAEVSQQYAKNGLTPDRGVVVVLEGQPAGQEQVGQPFIVSHKQLDVIKPYVASPAPATSTATASASP